MQLVAPANSETFSSATAATRRPGFDCPACGSNRQFRRRMCRTQEAEMLTRYWLRFRNVERTDVLTLGCGVTAYSLDDAIKMLQQRVFKGRQFEIA